MVTKIICFTVYTKGKSYNCVLANEILTENYENTKNSCPCAVCILK